MHKAFLIIVLFFYCNLAYTQPTTNYGGEIHYQSQSTSWPPAYSRNIINDSITISYYHVDHPYTYRFSLKTGKWVSLGPDSIQNKRGLKKFAEVAGGNIVGFDSYLQKLYTYDNQMINLLDSIVPTFSDVYGCKSRFFGYTSTDISDMRHSTDGLTWASCTFPSNLNVNSYKLEDLKGDRIIISYFGPSFVLSQDGGATFNAFNNYPTIYPPTLMRFTGDSGLFVLADSCYFSPDMGLSWQSSAPLPNATINSRIFHLRGDSLLAIRGYSSSPNKLSTDGGLTWNNQFNTLQGNPEHDAFMYGDTLYVVDSYFRIKKLSSSGGLEYLTFPSFYGNHITDISVQNNRVLLALDKDEIAFSEDGGYNFSFFTVPIELRWASFLPNSNVIATTSGTGIYHSLDGKIFNRSVGIAGNMNPQAPLSFDSTGNKVIYTGSNHVGYSINGGQSFNYSSIHSRFHTTLTPGGQIFGCDVSSGQFIGNDYKLIINKFDTSGTTYPIDTIEFPGADLYWERMVMMGENMGWIFLSDRSTSEIKVLFSNDGWQSSSVLSTIPYTYSNGNQIKWLEIYSPEEIILSIGKHYDTYYSSDTGQTFHPMPALPILSVNSANISTTAVNFGDTNTWFMGIYGYLVMNDIESWPNKKPVDLSTKSYFDYINYKEVYPNPTQSKVFLPNGTHGKVKVHSLNGVLMAEVEVVGNSIDLSFLKPGIYILESIYFDEKWFSKVSIVR